MNGDARRRPTAHQWAGARELGEGEFSIYPRLAVTLGVSVSAVRKRAAREGWKKPDFGKAAALRADRAMQEALENPDNQAVKGATEAAAASAPQLAGLDDVERDAGNTDDGSDDNLCKLSRLLSQQAGRILSSAEAQHGILNKPQLDALASLIKLAEKFEALAAQERVQEKQTRSDDEIAAVLERIDDRIVELAQEHAARLGAEKSDG